MLFAAINAAGITAANTVAADGGGGAYLWIGNDFAVEGNWVWDGDNDLINVSRMERLMELLLAIRMLIGEA